MTIFQSKQTVWIIFFVILLVIMIPLFFYFFKNSIISFIPSNLIKKPGSPQIITPGSCLILEEKYCSQAEVIDWTNSLGQKMKLIGFNLPAGVPLLMPIDGQVAKVELPEGTVNKGLRARISDPDNTNPEWYYFEGDMQFANMFSLNMKKGEVFGYTNNTGIKNADHQILFYIIHGLGREATINEDKLKKMFQQFKL